MKKLVLLAILALTTHTFSYAQYGVIDIITILPISPTTNDQVFAIVSVHVSSSNCTLDISTPTVNGNNIDLDVYYCGGMLATICDRTDTISLGFLQEGTYDLKTIMYGGCGPYFPSDTLTSPSFTVSLATQTSSISRIENPFMIYPNPLEGNTLHIQNTFNKHYSLICYDLSGKVVYSALSNENLNTLEPNINAGFYFLKISTSQNEEYFFKISKLD